MDKKIIRTIGAILGVAAGLSVAQLIIDSSLLSAFSESTVSWINAILYIVLGGLFGLILCLFAPKIINACKYIVSSIEKHFTDVPLSEIFIGVIGLILGLTIAYLLSTLAFKIRPQIVGIVISIGIFLILGYLGWMIPTKRIKEINLPKWFRRSERPGRSIAVPKVLDTSAIIDGRFFDVYKTGIVEGTIIIPQFVLDELRHIADSADPAKRARGRRGLDMLEKMQESQSIAVYSREYPEIAEVDAKLIRFAMDFHGMVVTNDFNLNKVASVQGVPVFNINDLANALRIIVTAGENIIVTVVKEGKEATQGVAYFDDGTMIVIDGARGLVGRTIAVTVTSVIQTSAGRMVFAKIKE